MRDERIRKSAEFSFSFFLMKRDIGRAGSRLGELEEEEEERRRETARNGRRESRTIKLKLVAELFNCIFDSGAGVEGGGGGR